MKPDNSDNILRIETGSGQTVLHYRGRLDATSVAAVWEESTRAVTGSGGVSVDAKGVDYLDGAGAGLMIQLKLLAAKAKIGFSIAGLDPRFERLVESVDADLVGQSAVFDRDRRGFIEQIGQFVGDWAEEGKSLITYVGECAGMFAWACKHPRKARWRDVGLSSIHVGVNSMPILLLIGFLIGLIMSFQSAVSLQRFAAEIFVPNMLGLVMFREMGALVTAILLAARSGSAFAAEIGTMKVNEEVDALVSMGLSPMRFLVLPKVLATMLMVPIMTMFFNFASLLGGAVVMLSLGFPLATFTSRVFMNTKVMDFTGGMLKVMVFSLLISGIGCLRGLQTRSGAGAVGVSTTRAVVSGLILIAVADGLFAVAFFFLGI
ncbi:MAG: ABC transporter permease [Proteobacteria bacterium]|nr:ABC transporter permease [Pseudomonadota bacterium]